MAIKLDRYVVESFVLAYLQNQFDKPAPIPKMHKEMWEMACSGKPRVAIAAPRNHAKSTAITHSLTLAKTLFGEKRFGVIFSNSWDIAVKFLTSIKSELALNEDIQRDFGPIKFVKDTEDEIIVQCLSGSFCLMARGTDQGTRGLKWGNLRPDYMVFDDPEGDEQVANPERRIKFRSRVLEVFLPMGGPELQVIWVDTIKHYDSMLERLMTDSMWVSKKYQAHKSFDDFSELLWPAKWTEQMLRDARQMFMNQGNENGYSREYLNIPMTDKGAYFRVEDSLPMREIDYAVHQDKGLSYVAAGDFAFTKNKRSDYTVLGVAGIDSAGNVCLVDVRRDRIAADEIVDEMLAITKRYDVQMFGVPVGKDFESFKPFLESQSRKEGIYVPIEMIPDSQDKPSKCQAFRGYHRMGMVRFDKEAEWWLTVDDEMRKFTMEGAKSGHDDIIDMLGILGQCIKKVARPDTVEEEEELEYYRISHDSMDDGRCPITGY